jgi:hypothetical protein
MGEELWYVKLANGDVHRVTIDQLDGAFQAGHIDETTMVLAAGASQWTTLGEVAGLDDESAAPPQAAPVAISYVPQTQPARIPAAAAPVSYAPPARVAPAAGAPVPYAPARVATAAAQAPYAPAHGTPYAVAVSTRPAAVVAPFVPNSLRPMSMDLGDLDLDLPVQRKSRAGRFVVAVVALAAIAGGVGFTAQRAHIGMGGGGSDLANVAAAAAMAAPPPVADPVVAPPPPAAPTPAAWAPPAAPATNAAPSDGSPMNPQFTSRFNEDTTKKLLSADKSRETKSKSRHASGGAPSSSKSKSTTFTTGGNKFDPLNSSI